MSTNLLKNPAALLVLFALIGSTLVAFVFDGTEDRIAENERQALLRTLNDLVPAALYDNELLTDKINVVSAQHFDSLEPVTIYRARINTHPVAAVLNTVAPDGYNGRIRLLVAILEDGSISGVRVVTHKETPGLGDGIEIERSDWILQFNGRSLSSPDLSRWRVRKDGGEFDQLTGATITPRAIVKTVRQALIYFSENKKEIFSEAALPVQDNQ